jgi:hypothetical protein
VPGSVWRREDSVPRLDLQQIVFSAPQLNIASLENATAFIAAANPGFTHLHKGPQTWTQTIEVHDDFNFKSLPVDSWGLAYELDVPAEAIAQMRSGKWVAHALWALFLRFYELAKVNISLHLFEKNLSETFVEMHQPSVILSFSRPRLSFSVLARDFDALRLVVFLIR